MSSQTTRTTEAQTYEPLATNNSFVPEIEQRNWPGQIAYYQNVEVKHLALYMQDPFERIGSNDGKFKIWDLDDLVVTFASPLIYVANIVTLPVAMASSPPWQYQTSRSIYPVESPKYALPGISSEMIRDKDVILSP